MTYNNKDGPVITKIAEREGRIITFIDENDYIKKERALRTYNMTAYKELIFVLNKKLKYEDKPNGNYEYELPADESFKKVYGKVKLKYTITNDIALITDITPGKILLELFSILAPTYKGVPYTNEFELFKIKTILGE